MEFKSNYPYVLVHGMYGFGEGELLHKFLPYWGMCAGDMTKYLGTYGIEAYAPAVSGIGSAWDRTCELYAKLVGGRVDYGKAHSEKYGHKRFGRTFSKPLIEGWGPDKKINLFGHSFGGPTIRLLSSLLANGNKEEMDATDADDISPLFTGGKDGWIHSITAVAAVQEGTTVYCTMKPVMDAMEKSVAFLANVGSGAFSNFVDFQVEQWGLNNVSGDKNTKAPMSKELRKKMMDSKDTIYYDISLEGARKTNEMCECFDSIYYFSMPCRKTNSKYASNKLNQEPRISMFPAFRPFSHHVGKMYKAKVAGLDIDEKWRPNDGLMPTIAETAPVSEPKMDLEDANGEYKKGVWYVYDTFQMDHIGILGGFFPPENPDDIRKLYVDHCKMINSLE